MAVRSLHDEPGKLGGRAHYRLTTTIALLLAPMAAHAQADTAPAATPQEEAAPFGEILVTATKRGPTNVQDVPAAITAFGQEQLEAENFRDISSLSYKIPNVQLDSMGVVPGFANFSIRGQGFTNSQLTLEPTVGIFVDGIYQGVNAGIITENFDLAGIEVLRGPQGLLFGRNVTGGAVLIRTSDPSMTLTGNFRVGIESGPNYSANGVVSGPIAKGVAVKLAMLYNRDEGYFTDAVDGTKVDRSRSFVVRPAILWQVSDDVKLVVRAEHGENEGNGPANKNLGVYPQDDFRFANNIHGPYWTKWDQVTAELNIGVGLGDGTITNIAGWRKLRQYAAQDSDSTIMQSFSAVQRIRQEQFSNELRYSGAFGDFAVTTGIFYFWQNPSLVENREVLGGFPSGGGKQTTKTLGIFASLDWSVSDALVLNFGARYNHDAKSATVSIIRPNNCNLTTLVCNTSFTASESWSDISPRVGFKWQAGEDVNIYGYYTKGFRSGGYPLRQTALNAPAIPFNPEVQHAFELGFKGDLLDRRLRLNGAVFYNLISGLQRVVTTQNLNVGTVQVLTNTADADVWGAELEAKLAVTDQLVVSGFVGYTDSKFTNILYDISGDGVINARDYSLLLPRLSPWTYGAALNHDLALGFGTLSTRVSYNYRDGFFSDDANLAPLKPVGLIDANMTLTLADSGLEFSVFGRNLTNEVTSDLRTPLPNIAAFGGAGAAIFPLKKGRVIGAEMRYRF